MPPNLFLGGGWAWGAKRNEDIRKVVAGVLDVECRREGFKKKRVPRRSGAGIP